MSVKIALIGAGYMAAEHARAFAAHPGVAVVGVVGRTPARVQTLAAQYAAPVFASVDELWAGTAADIVVVAVNELSMTDVCEQVFRHPWRVLLEKPVGVDLADARQILASARRQGAEPRTWVGLNRRAYGSTRAALSRLSDDGPRLVSVLDQQDMEAVRQLGTPEEVVRNYMYANSIHLIDYFQIFCRGELENVHVIAPWTPAVPTHVVAVLDWSSGDRGVYQAVWNGPGPWAVSVAAPEMRLEMRPLETLTVQLRGERRTTPVAADPIDGEFKPGLYVQATEMLRTLESQTPALAGLEEAVGSMALCAKLYGMHDT